MSFSSPESSTYPTASHISENGISDHRCNGHRSPDHKGHPLTKNGFYRKDLVRLVIQALHSLGYSKSAEFLESESGILLQSPVVSRFRSSILEGDWNLVETLISDLRIESSDALKNVKFLIYQQKFLELLECKQIDDALHCLRHELAPSNIDSSRLHRLTSLIMCSDIGELKLRAAWDGASGDSRKHLLRDLQSHISPVLLLPEDRLETLLSQAVQFQKNKCLYHNTRDQVFSLFEDHICSRDQIPRETQFVLDQHQDEVWYIQFSHNGAYLASASKDNTVIIWDVTEHEVKPLHVLRSHGDSLSFLAWSPDDTHLLTCSNDRLVKLWDVKLGTCIRTFSRHTDHVTACAWLPDGRRFVSGGLDKCIFLWDINGADLKKWTGARVNDLAVSNDGTRMVATCSEKKIRLYSLVDDSEDSIIETESITSLCLSADSQFLLVNISTQCTSNGGPSGAAVVQEIHVWDLKEKRIVQKYRGQKQGRFVIRSCFGGTNQAFVISGSEDSQVYIWHRHNGTLLEALPGHSGTVNAVSWNPVNPHQFASASDDHTIRIWGLGQKSGRSHS
mmetsp:Transcript_7295/g.11568  ORF Transcript_7295/g.11568 Transcript_7295/m.11568 type:complete len:562 (-) Transcript_7295:159-1844(-)